MSRRAPGFPPLPFAFALVAIALPGCSDDDPTGPSGSSTVTMDLQGLGPMVGGLNYQAWVVAQGPRQSVYGIPLVVFNVDDQGRMVDPVSFDPISGPYTADVAPESVLGMGISLELSDRLVTASSNTFILGGPIEDGSITLVVSDWLGIGVDLSQAGGSFVLGALTNGAPDQQRSGLWFLDPGSGTEVPGLSLPDAPEGWDYEGWVVIEGVPVSTGKFFVMNTEDSSNRYSEDAAGPPFPGEDFLSSPPAGLTFPTDLAGATVFVTMEPWQGWDAAPGSPFFVRVLEGVVPGDATPMTPYSLTSLFDQLPTGTASVS